jgi:hypothetical protein
MSIRKTPNKKRTKRHTKRNLIIAGTVLLLFSIAFIIVSQNTDKGINTYTNNTDTNNPNINTTTATVYNSAADFEYGWDKNVKDGIEITKYVGSQKEVRIPPTIQKFKVTSIGNGTFRGSNNITSVTIPDSVTTIGNDAFYGCTGLVGVTLGNGITSIGSRAFYGCSSLASITIPKNVTRIGVNAFKDCTNLTSVTFQGRIVRNNFGSVGQNVVDLFPGDLPDKYLNTNGGPGTYTRFANGQEWRKR